ncbi:winged helix-turn-helix domain-containing protein [Roseibium polysiphoniae]|uniref:Winged helix-turn-helix domain-containing protein n=1 Tax=Roseibium polysiphoniae TaxID=2571221 RepID=A0ABR9C9I6_9HYPH|nr:helix-turn-helix domain-containing protein [Roseibium polysiphoniae]MBD8876199.1 winged helix-turn-helix domain-containing protein [Roseibium polysiphoniae]
MRHTIRLGSLCFDESFVSAVSDGEALVTFTRAETRLIKYLVQYPNQVRSRAQLLDAVSHGNEEKLDRSIDFLINRLRQKLGDDAKNPTFIATRYGEGYIWLASQAKHQSLPRDCHAVVGPVFGLSHIGHKRTSAELFAQQFQQAFQNHFSDDLEVVFDPDCPKADDLGEDAPKIGIELSFVLVGDQLECVFRGYLFRSDRTVFVKRISASNASPADIEVISGEISSALRTGLATEVEAQMPLAVGMIEAGKTFTGIKGHWSENDQGLRAQVNGNPTDYRAKIMLATNIHTKYLQDSVQIFMSNADPRKDDEDEIETLVTESLPHLQNEPTFLLPAAKLLFFIDRGYNEMAVKMAERLHKESTSLAASLPVVGQMRVFTGQNEDGQRALDQALELCEQGSQFEIYLMILKCEALAAVSDRDGLDQILDQVCARVPQIEVLMQVLFTCSERPSKIAQQALVNMPPAQARGMVMLMHYVYGRLLQNRKHRANAYRTPVSLFSKQFGPNIIPDEVRQVLRPCEDPDADNNNLPKTA